MNRRNEVSKGTRCTLGTKKNFFCNIYFLQRVPKTWPKNASEEEEVVADVVCTQHMQLFHTAARTCVENDTDCLFVLYMI